MLGVLFEGVQGAAKTPAASDTFARLTAIFALVIGGAGLALSFRSAFVDRPRIKVGLQDRHYLTKDDTSGAERVRDYLHVQVTNLGRRPTAITYLWIEGRGETLPTKYNFVPPSEGFFGAPPPAKLNAPIGEHEVANFYFQIPMDGIAHDWDLEDGRIDSMPVRAHARTLSGRSVASNWTPMLCRPENPEDPNVLTAQLIIPSMTADYLNHRWTWRVRKWRGYARQSRRADRARKASLAEAQRTKDEQTRLDNEARVDELRAQTIAELAKRPEGLRAVQLSGALSVAGFDMNYAAKMIEALMGEGVIVALDDKQNPLLGLAPGEPALEHLDG